MDGKQTRKRVLTPAKDGAAFEIVFCQTSRMFKIINRKGGKVPNRLSGGYTEPKYAKVAITSHMLKLRKGE